MATGNFSNNGQATFDPLKQYIGIRLQQGVPLLDRDWNELEDIRRYFERMTRLHYLGEGAPGEDDFRIQAPTFRAPNDFLIGAGRCIVNGYDVTNAESILYSEQPNVPPLPPATTADLLTVYLLPSVVLVDGSDDPDLLNRQDINLETCLRDRLVWQVRVVRHPEQPPADAYPLARITRPAGATLITDAMIQDLRRTPLNLADLHDRSGVLSERMDTLTQMLSSVQLDIEQVKRQLARLFWDVTLTVSRTDLLFGGDVQITATVKDGLGAPVRGAFLAFATDWGILDPATAVTNSQGRASIELAGIDAPTPPPRADIGILKEAIRKIEYATLSNPGAIQYSAVRFEPQEMAMISQYTPASVIANIAQDLPTDAIVARPPVRTATVTVYAKDGEGAIVRGVGNIQVRFGMWVRDWMRTKIIDTVRNVRVGARVGDLLRQGIQGEIFNPGLIREALPDVVQQIQDDAEGVLKRHLFTDTTAPATELSQSGTLAGIIAQTITSQIGQQTSQAITTQMDAYVADASVPLDRAQATVITKQIVRDSNMNMAAHNQAKVQQFGVRAVGL